ncbi:hypothetical protein ES703_51437 [subsurface metagenome]
MTKTISRYCGTAVILPVTAGWSRERSLAREAQEEDSSSRNVNLQIVYQAITIAAESKSSRLFFIDN